MLHFSSALHTLLWDVFDAVSVTFQYFYTFILSEKPFLSKMDILKLSTCEPCSFEPVGSVTNVFFDDRSQQVHDCPIALVLYSYN